MIFLAADRYRLKFADAAWIERSRSRATEDQADSEDERPRDRHLHKRSAHAREEAPAYPGYGLKLESYHHYRYRQGYAELRYEERQGVHAATKERPAPVTSPLRQGAPRPVSSPSSESASEIAMLMAAPMAAERPTSSATRELPVERAAAKSGAMVEMEPSESPSNAGWPVISRKSLRPLRDASVPPPEAGGYCMPISLLPSDNIMVSAADQSAKGANPIRKGPLRPRPAVSAPKDRARRSPLLWRGAAIFVSSSVAGRTIVTPPTLVLPEPSGGAWPERGKEDQPRSRGCGE